MSKPYKITLKRAVTKIREAYTARTLQAQGAAKHTELVGNCKYEFPIDGKVYHCAVGCILPKTVMKRVHAAHLNEDTGVRGLIDRVISVDGQTQQALFELQAAHDALNNSVESRTERRKAFLKVLKKWEKIANA